MEVYAFWNNKGGTGKTSLAFQSIISYAEKNPKTRILVIDLCPQANLSELLLGGLTGNGSSNLAQLHGTASRRSIGGYFQARLPSPYTVPATLNCSDYICKPAHKNHSISVNIDLLAGDAIVELQANAIATLSNTQIPGTDTWIAVIDWLKDFLVLTGDNYDIAFVDSNPSFSMYTQIALSTATKMIIPVMADDSSRRAVQNAFSLVHGLNLPSPIYSQYSFTTKLTAAGRSLPLVHLIVKNRLTQYMGPASAYGTVLSSIDNLIMQLLNSHPSIFSFAHLRDGNVNIRDFQTTGVVAFAEGKPFSKVRPGVHTILGHEVQVSREYIDNCSQAVDDLVKFL